MEIINLVNDLFYTQKNDTLCYTQLMQNNSFFHVPIFIQQYVKFIKLNFTFKLVMHYFIMIKSSLHYKL